MFLEPPIDTRCHSVDYPFISLQLIGLTVPLARRPEPEPDRVAGGGRNEQATGGGAGQSVGQPVGLSFPASLCPRHVSLARCRNINDTSKRTILSAFRVCARARHIEATVFFPRRHHSLSRVSRSSGGVRYLTLSVLPKSLPVSRPASVTGQPFNNVSVCVWRAVLRPGRSFFPVPSANLAVRFIGRAINAPITTEQSARPL